MKTKKAGPSRNGPVVFLSTFSDLNSAHLFSKKVLAMKLAACLNVVGGITSHYFWKGRVHSDQEVLVIGKTTSKNFEKLKSQIKNLHPYKLPELISLPISDGVAKYLSWIKSPR